MYILHYIYYIYIIILSQGFGSKLRTCLPRPGRNFRRRRAECDLCTNDAAGTGSSGPGFLLRLTGLSDTKKMQLTGKTCRVGEKGHKLC